MQKCAGFESAVLNLCERIRRPIEFLPDSIKESIEEIRVRAYLPLAFTVGGQTCFLRKDGTLCPYVTRDLITVEENDLKETFLLMCDNSVYAHASELKEGFIILKNGNRAGVCGNFSGDGTVRDISSVNIRIAHEIIGCADRLYESYEGKGLLIAGPPGSGKTTVLRDLIRQLSGGALKKAYRVSVIDGRGEISGSFSGKSLTDLGVNTDVLMIADKSSGVQIAIRTLFPDIVAFDEIGTKAELNTVSESFNAGVQVITTAHAGSLEELYRRSVTKSLISSGAIGQICLLPPSFCEPMQIIRVNGQSEDAI